MVRYAATSDAPRVSDLYVSKIALPKNPGGGYPQLINVIIEAVI